MPLWGVQSLAATAAAGVRSHKSVSACRRVCVTATCLNALHYSTSHRPPPLFPLNLTLSPFPPFLFFLSSVMLHCVAAQNTDERKSFCVYHTCTCSLLAGHQTVRAIWFAFLSGEAGPALASLSTYEMKSDAWDARLWKLESLNRARE